MNQVGKERLGWSRGLTGRCVSDVHPSWAAKLVVEEGIPAAIREGVWCGETAVRGGDGEEIPVSQVIMAHKADDGTPAYISTIMRDISESRRLREKLEVSERLLLEAQRLARMGHWELDHRTQRVAYSEEASRIFEFEPMRAPITVGLLSRVLYKKLHPADRIAAFDTFAQAIRNGVPYSMDYRVCLPDSRVKYVHAQGEAIYDQQGQPLRSIGTVQDVTEQVQKEELIRNQADLLANTLSTTTDGFWMVNGEGYIIEVNDALCAILGYTREELLGLHINDIERAENPEETALHVKKIFSTGSDLFVTRHSRKDGRIIDVEVSATRWAPHDRIVVFIRDITERTNQKRWLEEYSRKLEQMVETRTEELSRALAAAEAAHRAKSDFFERISHELYTPLNVILGFSQLLEQDRELSLQPDQKDSLQEILKAGREMNRLVNSLLDYSYADSPMLDITENT